MNVADTRQALSWKALTLIGALAVIWAVFLVTTHGTFVSPMNLALLARQMSVTSLLAVGMVMVSVTGEITSVGAMPARGIAATCPVNGLAADLALARRARRPPGLVTAAAGPLLHRDAWGCHQGAWRDRRLDLLAARSSSGRRTSKSRRPPPSRSVRVTGAVEEVALAAVAASTAPERV